MVPGIGCPARLGVNYTGENVSKATEIREFVTENSYDRVRRDAGPSSAGATIRRASAAMIAIPPAARSDYARVRPQQSAGLR